MIISMLSINEIPYKVQESTSAAILKGLKSFLPEKLPVTIADATRLEMTGLPVHTIMFFWSLVMEYGTCKFIGGGILMSGFLLRIYLLIIESGLQVLLKKGGDEHEAVNNSLMGCFFSSMREIWAAVLELQSKLLETFFGSSRCFDIGAVILKGLVDLPSPVEIVLKVTAVYCSINYYKYEHMQQHV